MTILLLPTEQCNFKCAYCFEPESQRAPQVEMVTDIPAMTRSLKKLWNTTEKQGSDLGIHGGECLMADRRELEALFILIQEVSGKPYTSVTTNGALIDEGLMRLFKKYRTSIGISVDGPEELNTLRGPNPNNKKTTLDYNRRLKKTIRKLKREKFQVSLMCILHTENAGDQDKLDRLKEWLLEMSDIGIVHGRTNPMYGAPWSKQYELNNDQLTSTMTQIFDLNVDYNLHWNPLREMQDNLLGLLVSPCHFGQCDYFRTSTVTILPDGTVSNCDRTFCDGLHVRPEIPKSNPRYEMLRQTDCKGCQYWDICNAACPCEGIDGDWRNNSRFCETYKAIYDHIGKRMRGMFPSISYITEGNIREPFKAMSFQYNRKPSVWKRNTEPIQGVLTPVEQSQQQQLQQQQGQVTGPGDKPHQNIPHRNIPHQNIWR